MSLFGTPSSAPQGGGGLLSGAQQPSGGTGSSLFGSTSTSQPQAPGGLGSGTTQNSTGGGLFGGGGGGGGLFGSTSTSQPQASGGLGSGTAQNSTGGGLFGGGGGSSGGGGLFGSTSTSQPQASGGLGSGTTTGGGLFGGGGGSTGGGGLFGSTSTSQPQASGGLGSGTTQNTTGGGLFGGGGLGQQPQQSTSAFGSGLGSKPLGGFGASTGNNLGASGALPGGQQQQQFGQTTMVQPQGQQKQQSLSSSLWSPGRAITGVHRTVPEQMQIIGDKWFAPSASSPFRAYIYNNVGEDQAPFYQPGPEDDAKKWEESLRRRPDSGCVPVLVRGFMELGRRAQRQKDFLTMMQTRLHELNNCLTELLSHHDLKLSIRIADCRRKHLALSKRCLSLAAKTQLMRNRGYAMDDAEEELKSKLMTLEKTAFDPLLTGRLESVWPRLMAIREQSGMLQARLDAAGVDSANGTDELDDQSLKTAKKILDDYYTQIQHLEKELVTVKQDFDDAQQLKGT